MLRVDNQSVEDRLGVVSFQNTPAICQPKKLQMPSCSQNVDDIRELQKMQIENSCKTYHCAKTKKCRAVVGVHVGGEELTNDFIGLNLKPDLNVGGNQIGYVYKERTIIDSDAYAEALRADRPFTRDLATRVAEHNHELYGKPVNFDGSENGMMCPQSCPIKKKACKLSKCRKADPLTNPDIVMGTDGLIVKQTVQEQAIAQENAGVVDYSTRPPLFSTGRETPPQRGQTPRELDQPPRVAPAGATTPVRGVFSSKRGEKAEL